MIHASPGYEQPHYDMHERSPAVRRYGYNGAAAYGPPAQYCPPGQAGMSAAGPAGICATGTAVTWAGLGLPEPESVQAEPCDGTFPRLLPRCLGASGSLALLGSQASLGTRT